MAVPEKIIRLWKSKGQIFEGLKNSIFRREDVEEIAKERMEICAQCDTFDKEGSGCLAPGTHPCCDQTKGGCGCSLELKTRSLSSACPKNKWAAELSQEEEDLINTRLGL